MGAYCSLAWIGAEDTKMTNSTIAFQDRRIRDHKQNSDGVGRPSYESDLLIFESPSHFVPFRVNPANPLFARVPFIQPGFRARLRMRTFQDFAPAFQVSHMFLWNRIGKPESNCVSRTVLPPMRQMAVVHKDRQIRMKTAESRRRWRVEVVRHRCVTCTMAFQGRRGKVGRRPRKAIVR